MEQSYKDIQEAALGLLLDATLIMSKLSIEYAVVGGWSPFLRYSKFKHPGTKDVDLLFKHGATEGELLEVFNHLRDNGYVASAKHPFQVLKVLNVAGRDFTFNIDLLHPDETLGKFEMMVDHVDLDVIENPFDGNHWKQKSISLPSSTFVFNGHLIPYPVTGTLPNGKTHRADVPLIDDVGIFVTKFQSFKSPKRPRDAFDIYLAVTKNENSNSFVDGLKALRQIPADKSQINLLTEDFLKFIGEKDSYINNVSHFFKSSLPEEIRAETTAILQRTAP